MPNNRDIVVEAQMIIDSFARKLPYRKRSSGRKSSGDKTMWFFAGITTSAAIFLAVFLKIY